MSADLLSDPLRWGIFLAFVFSIIRFSKKQTQTGNQKVDAAAKLVVALALTLSALAFGYFVIKVFAKYEFVVSCLIYMNVGAFFVAKQRHSKLKKEVLDANLA